MEDNTTNIYQNYSKIWQFNIQKIEELHKNLEKQISNLDNCYATFDPIYKKIEQICEVLHAIYLDHRNIQGQDYINKIKHVVKSYKKHYTREGIDFKLLNYLMSKIDTLRNKSIEDFPAFNYDLTIEEIPRKDLKPQKEKRFKWITFERNGSSFILPFQTLTVIQKENYTQIPSDLAVCVSIKLNGKLYKIHDIFHGVNPSKEPVNFIIIRNDSDYYPAKYIGKKVFANTDIISHKIKPFKRNLHPKFTPGRVRIFGANHIYLK